MFRLKKRVLSITIALLMCSNIYSLNVKEPETFYDTDNTDLMDANIENWDTISENSSDSTNSANDEKPSPFGLPFYADSEHPSHSDTPPSIDNSNTQDSPNTLNEHDYLKDSAVDARRQEIEDNHAMRVNDTQTNNNDFVLKKLTILTSDGFNAALSSPENKAQLKIINEAEKHRYQEKIQSFTRKKTLLEMQSEQKFRDAIISGKITELINQMKHPDFHTANKAYDELKKMWICSRKTMFLGPISQYSLREQKFITRSLLGVNVIRNAEREFIARPDYIARYADPQSLKLIQEHQKTCLGLQQKGDRQALCNEARRLGVLIDKNGKKDNLTTNICFAITMQTLLNPITDVLSTITHAPSIEKAYEELQNLKIKLLKQAEQKNIILETNFREWIIKQYRFDALVAAQDCYTSRADYSDTPANRSILPNPVLSILNIIEHRSLPIAHGELVNLDHQVAECLENRNVIDPAAQKEYIHNSFGRNLLEDAHKTYEQRSDHQKFVKSFISVDVPNFSRAILNNHNNYTSVAHEFEKMTEQVLDNANLCHPEAVAALEPHIIQSLRVIRTPSNDAEFVFNVTVVDTLLTEIQAQSQAIATGTPARSLLDRSPELLARAVEKFIHGVNPVTQVTNIGELIKGIGHLSNKALDLAVDAVDHPIDALHNILDTNAKVCDLLVSTAQFTSDLIIGDTYLSPEEYRQRADLFNNRCASIITAENVVDLTAQVAADFVFCHGLGIAFAYLKEIDAASKLENQAAKIADRFKQAADTHLANNPIFVTPEGVVIKLSEGMHNIDGPGNNIIKSSRALLESTYAEPAIKLKKEIEKIREFYRLYPKYDVPNFGNRELKIAYEHILGMELKWTSQGDLLKLGGFHHDFMGGVENSKVFQFVNKVVRENGCYSAGIIVDGIEFKKTFFPQHWSREDVASKIYEAYENFIKSGAIPELESNGKYKIRALTNESIKIEIHITQKGHIKSAYPIIEQGL